MKTKKLATLAAALCFLAAVSGSALAQEKAPAAKTPAPAAQPLKLTITGKIDKAQQGYIIQGQKPPELFNILNPNPNVLDRLVKSGKTVTIEAVSVMGDNISIEKIDGRPYQEAKAKGK